MRAVLIVLLCVASPIALAAKEKPPTTYSIPLPPKPDFSPVEWLVGEWIGKGPGRGPQVEIRLSVTFDLEKRFMTFREEISFPATKTAPASRESWRGILSGNPLGPGFVLRKFSSTGFITRYRVTVDGGEIHFNPEGGEEPPPGWLFRHVIQRLGDADFIETVQVAPPNRSFFNYYTAKFTKVPSP